MAEINLLDKYPRSNRPIKDRAKLVTDGDRQVARQFGRDFFDGDRIYGYGGYYYDPRYWTDTVSRIADYYRLKDDASVLDVGCGKGFMLYDFKRAYPKMTIAGIDISEYAIQTSKAEVKNHLQVANARNLPFPANSFDLVISINTVHNLPLNECITSLKEIQRVSKRDAFVTMDAWRNELEKDNLLAWNLTALTYMHVDEWKQLFKEIGYTGDFYWFIAE